MAVNPKERWVIPQEDRKRLDEMDEAYVRQMCSSNMGFPPPFSISAITWLAEREAAARERTEALQAKEMALVQSTLKAAWIAAGAAIIAVVVGILTWIFPLH
jgi:hypothetical protein